jgi:DNA polymerase-3 subunit delta'
MIYPWQDGLWKELQAKRERMPHALLIHGPMGVGKRAIAEHLAQSLLCESDDESSKPCGACDACRWFLAGSHPDFRCVEPEALARRGAESEDDAERPARAAKPSTEIKVDQIRALDGFLNLRSHRDGRRVALVHPAEDLNANAANALLKALEEPPGQALFILVSHRPARLLATVRSRCVSIPAGVPDFGAAKAWLEAQGIAQAGEWLRFASGAPLRVLEYASEAGSGLSMLRHALGAGNLEPLATVNDREQLEVLAEVLQKHALDRAFASYAGKARFGAAKPSSRPAAWLRYARLMGRYRLLARHPLNPRLFAGEMLREMPKD